VSTSLGSSQRNRPSTLSGGAFVDKDLEALEDGRGLRWISSDAVAEVLLRAIRRGDLYAFTHPEWAPIVYARQAKIAEAFARAAES
jgi:hypothetical protein